jgi:outer membrane biosynthesis protein TonB
MKNADSNNNSKQSDPRAGITGSTSQWSNLGVFSTWNQPLPVGTAPEIEVSEATEEEQQALAKETLENLVERETPTEESPKEVAEILETKVQEEVQEILPKRKEPEQVSAKPMKKTEKKAKATKKKKSVAKAKKKPMKKLKKL